MSADFSATSFSNPTIIFLFSSIFLFFSTNSEVSVLIFKLFLSLSAYNDAFVARRFLFSYENSANFF
jgi:hypothetical protein